MATRVNSGLGHVLSVCPALDPDLSPQSLPSHREETRAVEWGATSHLLCDLGHVPSLSGPLPSGSQFTLSSKEV